MTDLVKQTRTMEISLPMLLRDMHGGKHKSLAAGVGSPPPVLTRS